MKVGEIWEAKDGSQTIKLGDPEELNSEMKMESSECLEESFSKPVKYVPNTKATYWNYTRIKSSHPDWAGCRIGGTGKILGECIPRDYNKIAEREK